MKIEIYPLDKIVIDGVPVYLGMKQSDVEAAIGAVQLLIDEDVLTGEYLGCHPCVCTSSLKMRTKDVIEKFLPAVGHNYQIVRLTGED